MTGRRTDGRGGQTGQTGQGGGQEWTATANTHTHREREREGKRVTHVQTQKGARIRKETKYDYRGRVR